MRTTRTDASEMLADFPSSLAEYHRTASVGGSADVS
jgi:hypothetical protein